MLVAPRFHRRGYAARSQWRFSDSGVRSYHGRPACPDFCKERVSERAGRRPRHYRVGRNAGVSAAPPRIRSRSRHRTTRYFSCRYPYTEKNPFVRSDVDSATVDRELSFGFVIAPAISLVFVLESIGSNPGGGGSVWPQYACPMRGHLRTIVAGVVIVVIAVSLFVESPGAVEGVALAIVVVAMMLVILRERRNLR